MSNENKNGFLEVVTGIHPKHDNLGCNSKKEEHSISDLRNPEQIVAVKKHKHINAVR
jgi:hypothetical protein